MSEDTRERRRCACDLKCKSHGARQCNRIVIIKPEYHYIDEYLCESCCELDTKAVEFDAKRARRAKGRAA